MDRLVIGNTIDDAAKFYGVSVPEVTLQLWLSLTDVACGTGVDDDMTGVVAGFHVNPDAPTHVIVSGASGTRHEFPSRVELMGDSVEALRQHFGK